jgi:hypothetical protein
MELSGERSSACLLLATFMLLIASACRPTERSLAGDYRLTRMSGREVRVWRPDRVRDSTPDPSVMLAGNVQQYAVRDPYIAGYANTEYLDPSAEPDARAGYFLIDTRSDAVTYGMDEVRWREELAKIGWTNPSLKKP